MTEEDEAIRQGSMFGTPANFYMGKSDSHYKAWRDEFDRSAERARQYRREYEQKNKSAVQAKPKQNVTNKIQVYETEHAKKLKIARENLEKEYTYLRKSLYRLEKECNEYRLMKRNMNTDFMEDILENRIVKTQESAKKISKILEEIKIDYEPDVEEVKKAFDKNIFRNEVGASFAESIYGYFAELPEGYEDFAQNLIKDYHYFADLLQQKRKYPTLSKYVEFAITNCNAITQSNTCVGCNSKKILDIYYCPVCGTHY